MYLEEIIENKKTEVAELKKNVMMSDLRMYDTYTRVCYSLCRNLMSSSTGIISEFKRKSPSKGFIKEEAKVSDIVKSYEVSGASGISVLADKKFFAGGPEDVRIARESVDIPILFKEFIIDEFQLHWAKCMGADVVLLIAAVLNPDRVRELSEEAKRLGLEVLLEIHSEEELPCVQKSVDIVGVNNRNLKTFEVDIQASKDLAAKIPSQFLKISESGISTPEMLVDLRSAGFKGFLMGERFMKTPDPGKSLKEFIASVNEKIG